MNWLDKLERKIGKFYIPNLMLKVIALNVLIYGITFFIIGDNSYILKLVMSPNEVMKGEVWRIVTFVFIPPLSGNLLIVILSLYFNYIAGVTLENEWGEFKFNIYFFFGMVSTIIVSFLTSQQATGTFVMLSIFLAFTKLAPDFTVLLFFILPVKMKWLGYLAWAQIIVTVGSFLFNGNITGAIISLVPILNYIIFFGKSNYRESKMRASSSIRMKKYKKSIQSVKKEYRHKCTVCGITDQDDPNMLFRYCSKCNGEYAYCENHIRNHDHIK